MAANKSHCLPFETDTASNGMPVCVEAMMFGLFSALTYPMGAAFGVYYHPVSIWTTARWMAMGAGALVFSVATQIYGNALFALLAVSGKYGPFDKGCTVFRGMSVCDQKFWNMIVTTASGLLGALLYVQLNKKLERWAIQEDKAAVFGKGGEACLSETDSSVDGSLVVGDVTPRATPRAIHAVGKSNVALQIWMGCLLDSIPSAVMLGLLTNRHQVSFGFLFALALANFPEAFSGASLMLRANHSFSSTMVLWTSVFLITGFLALAASFIFPQTCAGETFSVSTLYGTAIAEGLTGGLMLAMLATAMLPTAYEGARHAAGTYFVLGFMIAILMETLNSYMAGPQQMLHHGQYHGAKNDPITGFPGL